MKKILAIILAAVLFVSCTACGGNSAETPTTQPVETTQPTQGLEAIEVENPITYMQVSMADENGTQVYINAYEDGMGGVKVEYQGEEKKVGDFEMSILHNFTDALDKAGVAALNGKSEAGDGLAFGSVFVTYKDETSVSADFTGVLPQEFLDFYAAVDAFALQVVADLPVYVPTPTVMGEVDETVLTEIMQIMGNTGMPNLDGFAVSTVPMDEYFGGAVGLTSTEGVVAGVSCGPMMMAQPFSLVVVTVADETAAQAVAADFTDDINWAPWVCVFAEKALVAKQNDMILFLLANNDMYEPTAQAVKQGNWEILQEVENENA